MSRLKDLVYQAHREAAASNGNASSELIRAGAKLGVPFLQAATMAIASLGGAHAPVEAARRWISAEDPFDAMREILDRGTRVPGFGNSFFRDSIDPAWKSVDGCLRSERPGVARIIDLAAERLSSRANRTLYPNAALFTAVYCWLENVPVGTELSLFIEARLPVWAQIYHQEKETSWE